jgi:hypothetical protein
VLQHLSNIRELWKHMTFEKKKEALSHIIDYILVDVTYTAKHRGEQTEIDIVEYKAK